MMIDFSDRACFPEHNSPVKRRVRLGKLCASASISREHAVVEVTPNRVIRRRSLSIHAAPMMSRMIEAIEAPSPQPSPRGRGSAYERRRVQRLHIELRYFASGSPRPLGEGQGEG